MEKAFRSLKVIFIGLISFILLSQTSASFPYYGTKIGALKRLHHGVSGDVYAVDSRTLFIKSFNYDGEAPAAYFYVGNTNKPSNDGAHRLRDERGGTAALTRRYRNKDITLSLPEGKTLRDIKWFSVWCDEFAVNFGDVSIPTTLEFPRPQKISPLKGVHAITSDNIVIVDAQTLLIPNFSYDGIAPDAKFWVGRGQHPTPQGLRIPDENGKEDPLRRYDRKTIVLTLPGDLTIFDIGHFGVWCEAFTVDFGHVRVPEGLNVPPSLKMLGISPQSKLNCEVLYDDLAFEVRWAVAGESIVIQLVAKLENDQYMSFGISPTIDRSIMVGSDVVVAWVDKQTGNGFALDYYMDDKSQCSGSRGVCPDVNIEKNTNSIRLLNAAMVNGYSIVTYQRSLQATDHLDLPILTNGSQAIVWAIGPLNQRREASFHTQFTRPTQLIDFGRQPTWNCPMPESNRNSEGDKSNDEEEDDDTTIAAARERTTEKRTTEKAGYLPVKTTSEPEEEFYENRPQALKSNNRRDSSDRPVPTPKPVTSDGAWDIPAIQCHEPEDGVFYAQMGPTGGKHGYSAITGHVGWGISWYINGLLIPEIHVVRGKTYTFVVEGGNNPDIPAKYHPFYITDDPVGGYEHKREEEKKAIRIFAGVQRSRSGQVKPIGVGRLCNWTPDVDGPPADDYQSFGAYQRTLTLRCDAGEPGVITWKPDQNTPDTVYYHCFTHRYLGWKIHVHDSCDDARFAASERHEIRVPLNVEAEDFDAESSIRHETKVSPNDNFLFKHQTDLIKNHNMNGTPPKLSFEIKQSSEFNKLISDGIRAAEALEESILKENNANINTKAATADDSNTNIANPYRHQASAETKLNPTTTGSGAAPIPHNKLTVPEIRHVERTHILSSINHSNSPLSHANTQPAHSLLIPPIHAKVYHSQNLATIQHNQAIHPNAPHHFYHHQHHSTNNLTNLPKNSQQTIGLSEYLRPPQNSPLFNPVKLPGRRPFPGPINKNSLTKSVLPQQTPRRPPQIAQGASIAIGVAALPPPSIRINHYRKPLPIQPLAASVLLLGQPSDLSGPKRKTERYPPIYKQKPIIPVPYSDLAPQDSLQTNVILPKPPKKKPLFPVKILGNGLPLAISASTIPPSVFKKPFDMHQVLEEPTSLEIANMKPAVNKGFQPDTVVVESGFRPIIRHDKLPPETVEQIANRREDPGTEIDEAMETDTLFLTAQKGTQTQNFEPMFIPSPLDSINETKVKSKPLITLIGGGSLPEAAELRNTTVEYKSRNKDKVDNTDNTVEASADEIVAVLPSSKLQEDTESEDEHLAEIIEFPDYVETTSSSKKLNSTTKPPTTQIPIAPSSKPPKTKQPETLADIFELSDYIDSIDSKEESLEFPDDYEIPKETTNNTANLTRRIDEEESNLKDEDMEFEYDETEYDDREAQAAERIDTYYLPPDNRKIPHAQIPSGAVVTFDGKSVIDRTLVLPPKLDERDIVNSHRQPQQFGGHAAPISKIDELVRSTPQFAPFRGEAPPPVPEFISTDSTIQLKSNIIDTSTRSLPMPSAPAPALASSPISTKLQLLKSST